MSRSLGLAEAAITSCAREAPERLAIVDDGMRLTYADLDREITRFARALTAAGVGTGHVVSIWLPPWWASSALFNSASRLAAVSHVMSHGLGNEEAYGILQVARPRAIVVGAEDVAQLARMRDVIEQAAPDADVFIVRRPPGVPLEHVRARSAANGRVGEARRLPGAQALIFTSGTTGSPKGVIHTPASLTAVCTNVAARFELGPGSVIGLASPIGHIRWVMYGAMMAFQLRGTLLTAQRWIPYEWIDMARAASCEFAAFSPKHVADLVELRRSGHPRAWLKTISLGGSYLATDMLLEAERVLDARIVRSYGCTEFPSATSGSPHEPIDLRCSLDGHPLEGVELVLAPVSDEASAVQRISGHLMSRILLRGAHVAAGIISTSDDQPGSITGPEGWLRTEDFAEMLDGHVRIIGRSAELIIRNGENISAPAVESVLIEHPAVADVAVAGEHDPIVGERLVAVLVPSGTMTPGVADLVEFLRQRNIERHRWPERVVAVAQIPRTSSGKIARRSVWELVNRRPGVLMNPEGM
jgi:acyl-coenzyme A synthetase/AMP-(fatty) acid ligase